MAMAPSRSALMKKWKESGMDLDITALDSNIAKRVAYIAATLMISRQGLDGIFGWCGMRLYSNKPFCENIRGVVCKHLDKYLKQCVSRLVFGASKEQFSRNTFIQRTVKLRREQCRKVSPFSFQNQLCGISKVRKSRCTKHFTSPKIKNKDKNRIELSQKFCDACTLI